MNEIIISVISYLLGSIPTAYLAVKFKSDKDIREEGSGNVGAMNSFEVTNSKLIGLVVLIVDAAKGAISVLIAKQFGNSFSLPMIALIFSVAGHCFNPWLKFKGGRGLATAAGGALVFSPVVLVTWLILWLVAYLFKKNIHFANISATILTLALALDSTHLFNKFTYPPAQPEWEYKVGISIALIIILIKHWKPLKEYFTTFKSNKTES